MRCLYHRASVLCPVFAFVGVSLRRVDRVFIEVFHTDRSRQSQAFETCTQVLCQCRYLAEALTNLRHDNGSAVCELYGTHALKACAQVPGERRRPRSRERLLGAVGQGPVVAFSLFRGCGAYVGYRWVPWLPTSCTRGDVLHILAVP